MQLNKNQGLSILFNVKLTGKSYNITNKSNYWDLVKIKNKRNKTKKN